MSSPSQTADPSSDFKSMLDAALAEYKNKTGNDLLAHWLATELQTCESADAVLDVLREQAKTFEQSGDQGLMKWIDPLVHVLYTFSGALGDGVSLHFPPAKVIFTGIGVLLVAAKDARASRGVIADLFQRLESFFKRLEVYTQISLTTKMAEVLVKIVIELLSILSIATKEVKKSLAKLFSRKLLGRTDIEDALKRLDSLIQEEVQMAIAQILKVATEVKDGVEKTTMAMDEVKWTQIEKDIYNWFSPPDPSTNYNIACDAHHEGTAAWFFQGTIFNDWMEIGSLLWIHGKPGSGKSILCSVIIKHILSLRDAGLASLAFFYFDFRDEEKKQDFRNFVTSLLVQLSTYSNPCCKIISRIYHTHGKGTQQPSNDVLKTCLREMLLVASQKPIYIIIDALDECPDSSGMPTPREVVLDLLEGLVRLGLPNLRICVTSRPEIDIKKVIGPLASAVSLHDETGQNKDISDYVSSVVHSDRKMWSWRDEEKKLVVEELSGKADGMFRWVFCQLEVLRHCLPASIRQTLDRLPKSLDETYLRVLSQIPQANQAHAHRMLQCLMVAVRPLRVEELAELLAFDFDVAQGGIPKYRAAWRLDDQTQAVLSTCSSLVTIVDHPWDDQVVQFSHFSVKEFLMSDRLTTPLGDFSQYRILPGPAHTILTQACLGFLLHLDHSIEEESEESFPLAEYAAEHWADHARFEGVASCVKDGMKTLFDSDKPHFAAWVEIYDMDFEGRISSDPAEKKTKTPLYYSVLCGFSDLVEHLAIKHPDHVNATTCGQYRFPLLAALAKKNIEIAELLLEHGAAVDALETTGKTPLHMAVDQILNYKHLVEIVQFLLKHGSDVNTQDHTLWSPLHQVALWPYVHQREVARVLLEHKADVNSQNDKGRTPLHLILDPQEVYDESETISLNFARLLLDHGAEVNIRDEDNQTPLLLAMGRHWFELVRFLLEHGADTNVENDDGKTPLRILSESQIHDEGDFVNHARLLLLEHGASVGVNRRDKGNKTPLIPGTLDASVENKPGGTSVSRGQLQAEYGSQESHERGVDFNRNTAQDANQMTPLHLQSNLGPIQIAALLLDHGASLNTGKNGSETPLYQELEDANVQNKNHLTPLHLASLYGWVEMVRVLLNRGATANSEDDLGRTPLHLVVAIGSPCLGHDGVGVAQLLLEHGADVDARGKDGGTPLHSASYYGSLEIVRVLLDRGANANAEDNSGRTPFHLAAKGGCDLGHDDDVGVARLLLEHSADVDAQGKDSVTVTPLQLAFYYGRVGMVRVLLDHGATADSKGNLGVTLLHLLMNGSEYCSWLDCVRIAQLLLEHGADVNAQGRNETAPLHVASYYGRDGMVQVLLDHGATANSRDNLGWTPLHLAAGSSVHDGVRVAKRLLEHGADVNAQDRHNVTPLHVASYHGKVEIARVLLERGANASAKNTLGQTPLHMVSRGTYHSQIEEDGVGVAQLLRDHGADVNVQDRNGETPLNLASYHERPKIASLLVQSITVIKPTRTSPHISY